MTPMRLRRGVFLSALVVSCAAQEHTIPAASPRHEAAASTASEPVHSDPGRHVVYEARSAFAQILVIDEGPYRYLRFDGIDGDDQAMILRDDPSTPVMPYVRDAALALAHFETLNKLRVLMIGVGGGMFTSMLVGRVDGLSVDAVDIDPVVVDVAKQWFSVTPTERLRIYIADGADFVADSKEHWDVIFVDAYSGDGIPGHLATAEFFSALFDHLAEGGVIVLNLSVEPEIERSILEAFTLASKTAPSCVETEDESNLIVFGSSRSKSKETLAASAASLEAVIGFSLADAVTRWRSDCRVQ